jgi:hypothetical protein
MAKIYKVLLEKGEILLKIKIIGCMNIVFFLAYNNN